MSNETTTDTPPAAPAVGAQVERLVRPRPVEYGSDEHLTLLGSAWHLNLLTGVDLADVLAFGRACMEAERERWVTACCAAYADAMGRSGRERTAAADAVMAIRRACGA